MNPPVNQSHSDSGWKGLSQCCCPSLSHGWATQSQRIRVWRDQKCESCYGPFGRNNGHDHVKLYLEMEGEAGLWDGRHFVFLMDVEDNLWLINLLFFIIPTPWPSSGLDYGWKDITGSITVFSGIDLCVATAHIWLLAASLPLLMLCPLPVSCSLSFPILC